MEEKQYSGPVSAMRDSPWLASGLDRSKDQTVRQAGRPAWQKDGSGDSRKTGVGRIRPRFHTADTGRGFSWGTEALFIWKGGQMDDSKKAEVLGGCLLMVLCVPIAVAVNGWVLSVLWGWFIVPQFGVDPLSIPVAIGISTVVGMIAKADTWNLAKREMDNPAIEAVAVAILSPLFALAFGWIITLFM